MDPAEIQQKMRDDWDARARENAFHYVESSRESWDREQFIVSGRESVLQLLVRQLDRVCGPKRPSEMRVVEIGCGVGRMTRAMAELFGEVHGVDVSAEMIARAREFLEGVPNAQVHLGSGADLACLGDRRFDLAFSFIVFQHIPDRGVIENYVREAARVLRPGGLFLFQLQGDTSIPASPGDTWLGAAFSEREAREMVQRSGLDLEAAWGAGSQYFWLSARKPRRCC